MGVRQAEREREVDKLQIGELQASLAAGFLCPLPFCVLMNSQRVSHCGTAEVICPKELLAQVSERGGRGEKERKRDYVCEALKLICYTTYV